MANGNTQKSTGDRPRQSAVSTILLLLLILLILLLIAAATERTDILKFAGVTFWPSSALLLQSRLSESSLLARADSKAAAGVATVVDARLQAYYERAGGASALGAPLGVMVKTNGLEAQWFEYARLELHPDQAGGYRIERGRLGAEALTTANLPKQAPFESRAGARFFPETGHGLVEPFLSYWERAGGVEGLGYPISDQLQAVSVDGLIVRAQYFERGRVEQSNSIGELRLTPLGRILQLQQRPPDYIPPIAPTPVPAP
jgi:hypothetical protein